MSKEKCKGCHAGPRHCVFSDNIPNDCPCQECLVKVVCKNTCDEFDIKYEEIKNRKEMV
jgi:hypothetical protein